MRYTFVHMQFVFGSQCARRRRAQKWASDVQYNEQKSLYRDH